MTNIFWRLAAAAALTSVFATASAQDDDYVIWYWEEGREAKVRALDPAGPLAKFCKPGESVDAYIKREDGGLLYVICGQEVVADVEKKDACDFIGSMRDSFTQTRDWYFAQIKPEDPDTGWLAETIRRADQAEPHFCSYDVSMKYDR